MNAVITLGLIDSPETKGIKTRPSIIGSAIGEGLIDSPVTKGIKTRHARAVALPYASV